MKHFTAGKTFRTFKGQQGGSRMGIVVLLLCLGIVVTAVLVYRSRQSRVPEIENAGISTLSESTRNVLQNLAAPVEIRFYSLLDSNSVPDSLREFSIRVEQMLTEYELQSGGKLSITRNTSLADVAAAKSASTNGIHAFNIDKGDACFLGIAVVQNQRKESLPQLSPDWESALEADLSRAIARVSHTPDGQARATTLSGKPDRAAIEQLKQTFPTLETLPLEDGKRLLREAAFSEFKTAAQQMETQLKEAQQRLSTAHSDSDKELVLRELQQLQAAQAGKLKEIAARSQAQVEALESLKQSQATGLK